MRSKVSLHTACPFSTMNGTSSGAHFDTAARPTESRRWDRIRTPDRRIPRSACGVRRSSGHTRWILGGQIGGNADRLVRHQEIEALRGQDETVPVSAEHGVPERHGIDLPTRRQIEQWCAVPGAVPNLTVLVAPKIEPQEEPVRKGEVVNRDRRARPCRGSALRDGSDGPRRQSATGARSTGGVG